MDSRLRGNDEWAATSGRAPRRLPAFGPRSTVGPWSPTLGLLVFSTAQEEGTTGRDRKQKRAFWHNLRGRAEPPAQPHETTLAYVVLSVKRKMRKVADCRDAGGQSSEAQSTPSWRRALQPNRRADLFYRCAALRCHPRTNHGSARTRAGAESVSWSLRSPEGRLVGRRTRSRPCGRGDFAWRDSCG